MRWLIRFVIPLYAVLNSVWLFWHCSLGLGENATKRHPSIGGKDGKESCWRERGKRELKCARDVLWSGIVSCGGWGEVEVAHAPTCNWTLQPSLHVWVFVLLIKIGGWGNVQVVGGIPPTAKVEQKRAAQVDTAKIGTGHLAFCPMQRAFWHNDTAVWTGPKQMQVSRRKTTLLFLVSGWVLVVMPRFFICLCGHPHLEIRSTCSRLYSSIQLSSR